MIVFVRRQQFEAVGTTAPDFAATVLGKPVRVRGSLVVAPAQAKAWAGRPEIVLEDLAQLKIVESSEGTKP